MKIMKKLDCILIFCIDLHFRKHIWSRTSCFWLLFVFQAGKSQSIEKKYGFELNQQAYFLHNVLLPILL